MCKAYVKSEFQEMGLLYSLIFSSCFESAQKSGPDFSQCVGLHVFLIFFGGLTELGTPKGDVSGFWSKFQEPCRLRI